MSKSETQNQSFHLSANRTPAPHFQRLRDKDQIFILSFRELICNPFRVTCTGEIKYHRRVYKKPYRRCDETLIEQDLSARPLCNPPA